MSKPSQRLLDLPKHQSYILIHLSLCDNTKPHEHPAAERFFQEALDDARDAGIEIGQGVDLVASGWVAMRDALAELLAVQGRLTPRDVRRAKLALAVADNHGNPTGRNNSELREIGQ